MDGAINLLEPLRDSLAESLSASRERADFGAIAVFIHPSDPMIYMNYAVPTGRPTAGDVERATAFFKTKQRAPRFEFASEVAPELEPLLVSAGYSIESRTPIMAVESKGFRRRPDGMARMIESATHAAAYNEAMFEAFGMDVAMDAGAAERQWSEIRKGTQKGAVVLDYELAVSGGVTVGAGPIVELAGVGTRPAYRRRGFASMVSSRLCAEHFAKGGQWVWLSAGDDAAKAVYSALGFEEIGTQINCSQPID